MIIELKSDPSYIEAEGNFLPLASCPICKKWEDKEADTKYPPQELFDHLMSNKHSKRDLADLIQEKASWNQLFEE
jgi:hypothetical protein